MSTLVEQVRAKLEMQNCGKGVEFYGGANSRIEMICKLVEALDIATDLLPVPEHRQDHEWYEKEKLVHEALADLIKDLGIK